LPLPKSYMPAVYTEEAGRCILERHLGQR
jgi:hypothetical protein